MFYSVSVVTKLNLIVGLILAGMASSAGFALYVLNDAELASAANRSFVTAMFALLVVVVTALGVYVRLLIRQAMLRPIRAAADVIARVAAGDLTVKVGIKAHGETQRLLEAIEAMAQDLRSLVGEVTERAHTVADTSAQIAQGNVDLSQRTEEQASTLEETASSLEELTSTVSHHAHNARQASQLAAGATEVARKGGQVVGEVVSTMAAISDSSRKIADIISVIDGIAFQTNILALNAAVEAARAGDQGRGFAVVAAEVRNLAQRSAAAAKEIKSLIGDSVEKVQAGSTLVDTAGTTMQEIVASIRQVNELIAEIAAASQEQSSGIGQINTAVSQMEQVVQQNASLVEEATSSTESMREEAQALLRMVSRFKLEDEQPTFAAASAGRQGTPARRAQPAPISSRRSAGPASSPAPALAAPRLPKAPVKGEWTEF
jgi:methyl-accepting chemotaxis protein